MFSRLLISRRALKAYSSTEANSAYEGCCCSSASYRRIMLSSSFNFSISSVQLRTISSILAWFWPLNCLSASFSSLSSSTFMRYSLNSCSNWACLLSNSVCALSSVSIIFLISASYFSTSISPRLTYLCFQSNNSSYRYCWCPIVAYRRVIFCWQHRFSYSIAADNSYLSARSCFFSPCSCPFSACSCFTRDQRGFPQWEWFWAWQCI